MALHKLNLILGIILFLLCFFFINHAFAHSGSLDPYGCHSNQDLYHCHKGIKGGNVNLNQKQQSEAQFKAFIAQQKLKRKARARSYQRFDKDDWGHWSDSDHDCQDTFAEVLIFFSKDPVTYQDPANNCQVSRGLWVDPYSNNTYRSASALVLDPIVGLEHAFLNGAESWNLRQRNEFKNDVINLVPVHPNSRRNKNDKAPQDWLPTFNEYHCTYLRQWLRVKAKYNLTSSNKEKTFIKYRLARCGESTDNP
ncbi:GmrSD restriction endonuclease domain-containing protein [Algibacillus agarilyticus]|uniref:GmrSD restriction endonuclease domain-containing protein n=1 Tax=Algibacillus agarilyticus TaxID=2234133 RepID=UPI000DCFE461|nr:DUF1524 domain-containing protein [Algibacillus agarilyticus]